MLAKTSFVMLAAALAGTACSSPQPRVGVTAAGLECLCAADAPLAQYLPQTCDTDECQVPLARIGQPGVTVVTGGVTVAVDEWIAKPGSPGEYTGFKLSASVPVGAINYDVVAGTKVAKTTSGATFDGTESISLINFCDPQGPDGGDTTTGDDDGGGDDDGAGDCQDPDGCDTGGGDDGTGGGDDGDGPSDPASDNDDHHGGVNDTCYCAPPNSEAVDDGSSSNPQDCTDDVDGCGDGNGSSSDNDVG
jgi:hypothetical protein